MRKMKKLWNSHVPYKLKKKDCCWKNPVVLTIIIVLSAILLATLVVGLVKWIQKDEDLLDEDWFLDDDDDDDDILFFNDDAFVIEEVAALAAIGFGLAFVYNLYDVYVYWQNGRASQELSGTVQQAFENVTSYNIEERFDAIASSEINFEAENNVSVNITSINEARNNWIAYLSVPGTNIGHIVVQGEDNEFYLHRDIFGEPNVNGSLFMDYRNTPDFGDPSTIIFGHNMRNGTMFHNLRYFMEQPFVRANPHIRVITPRATLVYEIFATFSTTIDFDYIQVFFNDPYEFEELINELIAHRYFDIGTTPSRFDRILILSTCANRQENTRFVVAARLTH
jgi:sortase B